MLVIMVKSVGAVLESNGLRPRERLCLSDLHAGLRSPSVKAIPAYATLLGGALDVSMADTSGDLLIRFLHRRRTLHHDPGRRLDFVAVLRLNPLLS